MKAINRHATEYHEFRLRELARQHEEHLASIEATRPQPVELFQHPVEKDGKANPPRKLGNGLVVMPGDFYYLDGDALCVVAAAELDEHGAWQVVE